jgi:hypothetical protein
MQHLAAPSSNVRKRSYCDAARRNLPELQSPRPGIPKNSSHYSNHRIAVKIEVFELRGKGGSRTPMKGDLAPTVGDNQ